MPRLYANENFPLPAVEALRKMGHDVGTTSQAGQAGRAVSDEDVLQYAIDENRAVLTLNRRHFIRLHSETPEHAGLFVCTFDPDFFALARRIDEALAASAAVDGRLLRISSGPGLASYTPVSAGGSTGWKRGPLRAPRVGARGVM